MLRLSLNVSSTKLIIGQGHTGTAAAGHVIQGFATFIMGGNLLLGVVIFLVLLIVNFVVITKGAGRMAEVGARFALDGMPGKQLAIDADMSAGAITHAEAKARRENELAETNFFGSLDGASKFVKGDAVAGLLITAMNFVMGLVMGVLIHGMPLNRAFETYSILTVGDALVSQIPAVIISVASALLLARGGATGSADLSFFSQLGRYPAALATVSGLMALIGLVPGMPIIPFMLAALALGSLAWKSHAAARKRPELPLAEPVEPIRKSIGDVLDFDDIHIEFSSTLVGMVLDPATGLETRIANMRNHVAAHYGLILPEIRLTDEPSLQPGVYRIRLQGVEKVHDVLMPDRVLVLLTEGVPAPDGIAVKEPVYGAAAHWILPDQQEDAALAGLTVVSPPEVLATHLLEVIRNNLARLLTLRSLRRLLDEFVRVSDGVRAEQNKRLLDELVPEKVPVDLLLMVLRMLLEEKVSIRNLPLILEAVAEGRALGPPEAVAEHVRQRLGFQLVADLKRADGTIPLIQLAPEWEKTFSSYQIEGDKGLRDVALPPDQFGRLANAIAERFSHAAEGGTFPALVTSTLRRRFLRTVVSAKGLSCRFFPMKRSAWRRGRRWSGWSRHDTAARPVAGTGRARGGRADDRPRRLLPDRRHGRALPVFGEQVVPVRIRLGAALALTAVVTPAVAGHLPQMHDGLSALPLLLNESAIGLALGLMLRLFVLALQVAATAIAQSSSLSQMIGGIGPDPLPAVGQLMTFAALALAAKTGLAAHVAVLTIRSYEVMPAGQLPVVGDLSAWGLERITSTFALGFSLAVPFVIASVLYNLALGLVNRAMPQLAVALIGAPALTFGAMALMLLALPGMLTIWQGALNHFLAAPFVATP